MFFHSHEIHRKRYDDVGLNNILVPLDDLMLDPKAAKNRSVCECLCVDVRFNVPPV